MPDGLLSPRQSAEDRECRAEVEGRNGVIPVSAELRASRSPPTPNDVDAPGESGVRSVLVANLGGLRLRGLRDRRVLVGLAPFEVRLTKVSESLVTPVDSQQFVHQNEPNMQQKTEPAHLVALRDEPPDQPEG